MKRVIKINDLTFELFISREEIQSKVLSIAKEINADYAGLNPIIFITLKGAIFFACDLISKLNFLCKIDMIRAKSYGMQMQSAGKIEISELTLDIKDKHILLIEDIIDSGLTANALSNYFQSFKPSSFSIAALLSKPTARKFPVDIKYIGFEIPDKFVIGYGLDYAEYGRNLQDLYILKNN